MAEFGDVWTEIDLDNLKNNLDIVKKQLDSQIRIMAVVKADAYGHGLCEVARKLCSEGIDYFGVASIDEGVKLVKSGICLPILVLRSILHEQMDTLLDCGLIPSVNCIDVAKAANMYGCLKNQRIKIHIKIDTGSEGDGIPYTDFPAFLKELSKMQWVDIEGIYTHLVSAYGDEKDIVRRQLNNFRSVIDFTSEAGIYIPFVHAASSPAIFGYPESYFDMVRAGTVLYGLPFVNSGRIDSLKPVMQLKSRVVCIKEFEDGYSLGYGVEYKVNELLRIANVSIGYADATFLTGAKNLMVLAGGRRVPVYGAAHMDHIKIDITGLDDLKIGDEVVIFGNQNGETIRASDVATASGIHEINCEAVCFLGKRVAYAYIENGCIIKIKSATSITDNIPSVMLGV